MSKEENKIKTIELDRNKNRITGDDFFGQGRKKKTVNIADDNDFPDLDLDFDDDFPQPKKAPSK